MTELKPCPFCGAAASAWEWNGGARVDCSKWRADAYSVYTHYVGIGARTMEEAIELWNRRAEQPPAQPEQRWILCSERMPEEQEWIGTKEFGTTISNEVYVTFETTDGQRFAKHISFQNGKLSPVDEQRMKVWFKGAKPIAWMPLPEPYREERTEE